MRQTTDILMDIRRIRKMHECMLKSLCETYQLTQIEADIISFLYNNPEKDMAGDIVELRLLSKGNVSKAVDQLIQKKLVEKRQDLDDRRKAHLSLTPDADGILHDIKEINQAFWDTIFEGFSEEERKQYELFNIRISENTKRAMKKGGKNE